MRFKDALRRVLRANSAHHPKASPEVTMKTYWLSFADEETGCNLGICVVEVTAEQAEEAAAILRAPVELADGRDWVGGAIGQSLLMECNPGGAVQALEADPASLPPDLPRNRLIQEAELKRRGWA